MPRIATAAGPIRVRPAPPTSGFKETRMQAPTYPVDRIQEAVAAANAGGRGGKILVVGSAG